MSLEDLAGLAVTTGVTMNIVDHALKTHRRKHRRLKRRVHHKRRR